MRTCIAIIAALALAATAAPAELWRDVDVEALRASAPDREDYPDADGLYLMIQKVVEVDPDGAMTVSWSSLTRVLTLRGRETYSNPTYTYDANTERLSIQKAVTVRASGREVVVEPDAINDITPGFLSNATIYDNVLNKVVSFPVAGPGSTIELQLLEEREPAEDASFSGIEYFAAQDPILGKELIIVPPEGVGVTHELLPGLMGFEGEEQSRGGELVWRVADVPALVPEDDMPPATELYPRLFYSSHADWQGPSRRFARLFYPHVRTDGEVAERAASITAGLTSDEDRTRAIFIDAATNIRNVPLRLGLGGYEPHDADVVLGNGLGDTRDKAVVLVSMLRAAGIDAYPAAVRSRRGAFVESVPTLRQFTKLLVAVPEGSGYRFLDPFLDDAPYGYLRWGRGNTALVVKDDGSGELVAVPPFEPAENAALKSAKIDLFEGGAANLHVECELSGYFDRVARMTLKDATPAEAQKMFDASANSVSGGASDVAHSHSDLADLTVPATARQEIEAPDFAIEQGDMMIVRLPAFPFGFAGIDVVPRLAERKLPLAYPCEFTHAYTVEVTVPEGYEIVSMPDELSLGAAGAEFEQSVTWNAGERTLTWRQDLLLTRKEIAPDEYGAFKAAYDAVASPKNRLLLLKRA